MTAILNYSPHQSTISRWYGEFKRGRWVHEKWQEHNRHVTCREVEASLKISKTSIQKILHEELGVRKLVSRWIPHLLTEEQKAARVNWCQKTLDRFNSGISKHVYSIVSGDESIILHQDNASSHTAQKIRQYLTEENVELLDHPSYSPDLRPKDFSIFPKIRNKLRGQRFQSPEEAVDALKNAVLDLPANEWNKCFENWFERMQICINLRGEYFEKQ
ncbi:unnamed protein product [Acanthoscelides obtectus]|uniref:Transposase n=1 Tax=Acanthoscelides obtectus TaxID=200917 RepID=A0A9P0Q1H6_ACAOB|nr:unnamed protein product [Acanthoscelides obtectus]CAK1660175.1 Histone-lysine N-methyltransferase SETMAR [Acanthoscelides obtectus]